MWQRIYLERLKRDLDRWIERGWVTPAHAQSILGEMNGEPGARHIPQVLAIMGAVLFGFAAMSFVAANWAEIPKAIRLLMLFAAMWTAWGAAFIAERRGQAAYAEAGIVAGLALFGANIMLVAQIYHVTTGTPDWLLLWSLVALAAAWGLPSRSALAISFLLTALWSTWAVENDSSVHWAFLLPWAAATWLTVRLSWRAGLHLALITISIWLVASADALISLIGCGHGDLTALYTLVALLVWTLGLRISAHSLRFGSILEAYGMFIAFALLWTLQIPLGESHVSFPLTALSLILMACVGALAYPELAAKRISQSVYLGLVQACLPVVLYPVIAEQGVVTLLFYATNFLVLSIWLIFYGTRRNSRMAVNAGLIAFTGECLYLYFQTLGTYLDTATFFALGGIILIAGSLILPRIRRRLVASVNDGSQQ